jgi:pSer/pThr/pTyr-binding forkhead associated (FHA) protein
VAEVAGEPEAIASWALIGPEHELRLLPGAKCAVGRGEGVEYRLAADTVSRRHMEVIALENGQVRVANLSAKNPVRVRGEPLEGAVTFSAEESPVELKIGGVRVRLQWR